MKQKSCFWPMLIYAISMTSCSTDDIIKPNDSENIVSNSAGDFMIVNMRTNDTLTVKEGFENNGEETNVLTAHIRDTLKIIFNPDDNYKDYSFKKRYVLPDNRIEGGKEGDLEYKYVVTGLKKGIYTIDLNASSSGTVNDTIWNLTANGSFNLKIVSYANIDYRLSCPSILLEYATPQITYTGNDGTPVTFTIPDSEWEEAEMLHPINTIIVIEGDTVISEPPKNMLWTKHVRYDDFSVVDDELAVVYIPKDNIPAGNVNFIDGLSPSLNTDLEFVDDNGQLYKPLLMSIDIGITIGGSYGSTLSDIISKHSNYKGFHVESNGTYIWHTDKKQD